ncbi:hypothetical protein SGMN_35670 [Stenotrophomonas geniculata]|jgi:hypothetical protein
MDALSSRAGYSVHAQAMHETATRTGGALLQSGCGPMTDSRRHPMNTPGKPKPTWKQWHVLLLVLAIALLVMLIIVIAPW